MFILSVVHGYLSMGENLLRCTTQDEKGSSLYSMFFPLYFDPHKKMSQKFQKDYILNHYKFRSYHSHS
jgi:hypothetical protein